MWQISDLFGPTVQISKDLLSQQVKKSSKYWDSETEQLTDYKSNFKWTFCQLADGFSSINDQCDNILIYFTSLVLILRIFEESGTALYCWRRACSSCEMRRSLHRFVFFFQIWSTAPTRWTWTFPNWLTHCLRGPPTPAGWLCLSHSSPHTTSWSTATRWDYVQMIVQHHLQQSAYTVFELSKRVQ